MGGYGSGRRPGAVRPLVEDCLALDATTLHRSGLLQPDALLTATWRDGDTVTGRIDLLVGTGDWLIASYTVTAGDGTIEPITTVVPLTWTACTYGGRRLWFVCPGMRGGAPCRRRARKLYLQRHREGCYFRCRACHGLAYLSQRLPGYRRALRRALALAELVGGADPLAPLPPKPRGMHWRTYRDIRAAWNAACATFVPEAERRLLRDVRAIERRIQRRRRGRRR